MWSIIDILREWILIAAALGLYTLALRGTALASDTPIGAVVCAVVVYIVFSLYARRHHRPSIDPCLYPRRWLRTIGLIGIGAAIGAALCGLLLLAELRLGTPWMPPPHQPASIARLAASDLVPSFVEEIVFRATLLRIVFAYFGMATALAVSSVAFGMMHVLNPNGSVTTGWFIAAEAGLLFGCLYLLSGSVWLPAGVHFGWNLVQSIVYRSYALAMLEENALGTHLQGFVAESAGRYGPEDGWPALIIGTSAGLVALSLVLRARRDGRLPRLEPPLPVTARVPAPKQTRAAS